MTFQTGLILNNRYRIVNLLGQGGFGAVYRAWDLTLKKPCAVKQNFETSPQAHKQFEQEAVILARMHHNNLPRVIDHFTLPNQGQCLVMDFVEGEDLQEKLDQQKGALPPEQVLAWVEQVCDALDYLHNQSPPVIHRDIKPANIKITPRGQAMLVDFGIAKVYDPKLKTTVGARAVTPGYSPPEQYGSGNTDARADVYALGATLYALLTGAEPPDSVDLVTGQVPQPAPAATLNPAVSDGIDSVVARATQLDPDHRFQKIVDFKRALGAQDAVVTTAAFSKPIPTQFSGYPSNVIQPAVREPGGLRPLLKWFLGIIGVGILVLLIYLTFRVLGPNGNDIGLTQTSLAIGQSQTASAPSETAAFTLTVFPGHEETPTLLPQEPSKTPILPSQTTSPSLTPTPTVLSWPTSDTGEEACHLVIGELITAEGNTRLWSSPNVLEGDPEDVDVGQVLTVIEGPVWGRIRADVDKSGWWWLVRDSMGDLVDGWMWEDRIAECP